MSKREPKKIEYQRAVTYPRVSSDRQAKEGHGLDSQALRCEQFSCSLGLKVAASFPDEGISGGLLERPGFKALLQFLDDHPNEKFFVIIDDISRLARDLKVYLQLKLELQKRGAKIKSPNFNFEETPEGIFIENVLASKAQLDKDQNTRQVKQKMKARLEAGYWPFCPPPGLKFIKNPLHGKLLASDEPLAGIYKSAIEKFANFELSSAEAVRQYILNQYQLFGLNRKLSANGADRILKQFLYAGRVGLKRWDVALRSGHHTGFITWETYLAVQERLANLAKPRLRADYNQNFPLRNFLVCAGCGKPPTSAWFTGKCKKYPYYLCKQKDCKYYRKSIPRNNIEPEFQEIVRGLKPKPKTAELVEKILQDVWARRQTIEIKNSQAIAKQIVGLEEQITTFMQRIGTAKNQTVISQYETQIEKLAAEKGELEEGLKKQTYSVNSNFERISKVVVKHLQNPLEMWENKDYLKKRLFLGMYFGKGIPYDRNSGYQTPEFPLIVKLLTQKNVSKNTMVEMPGVKPGSKTNQPSNYSQD